MDVISLHDLATELLIHYMLHLCNDILVVAALSYLYLFYD